MPLDECCFEVEANGLCCFDVDAALCCFDVPPALLCCFAVRKEDMNYFTTQLAGTACCKPTTVGKTSCRYTCAKSATEIKPVTLTWHGAVACEVDDATGVVKSDWKLKSVTYEFKNFDGSALTGAATDPIIALHPTTTTPMEQIWKHDYMTRLIISGGAAGTLYRVEATATFNDCDSMEITCEYCFGLSIHEE